MKNFKKILTTSLLLAVTLTSFNVGYLKAEDAQTEKSKVLKIKKVLTLPKDGVKTPNKTFTFKFEKQEFNGEKDTSKLTDMPEIKKNNEEVKVEYKDSEGVSTNGKAYDDDSAKEGKQIVKLTDDLLQGVTFTKSGQYTYKVTETAETTTTDNKKIFTYSKAEYLVSLFVKEKNGKFIVYDIQIKQTKTDEGNARTDDSKKGYKPGKDDNDTKGEGNEFVFNNAYEEKAGNENPTGTTSSDDDKKGLVVSKTVKDETENTMEFTFKLIVEKDKASKQNGSFKYKIVSKEGTAGDEKTGSYGETGNEIKLKHGERVVLSDVLLGSTAKIEETVKQGYTPTITVNSTTKTEDELKNTGIVLSDEGKNDVKFENTKQKAVGFLLNNLPFIVLVGFGIFGVLFFVKNRKDEKKRA